MYLDDLKLNTEINLPEVNISKERMLEFAQIYDPLPLHCDEEYAKNTRFGQLVAPGVMTFMTVWAEIVKIDLFGDELIAGKSTKIEWFKPVFAGDTLSSKARISAITRRNAYNGIAEISIEVYNQHGELALTNVTEYVVKYRA